MAGLIDQLLETLNEQYQRYEELLGLSREKVEVIINNDVEELQKINYLENLVISQNQKLEKKREEITNDIATVLNQKVEDLTLTRLIELMEGQNEQPALILTRDRIRNILEELSEINNQNGQLIQNSLEYIEYSTNVMRSSVSQQPSYYSSTGEVYLDEPGFIDTKN